MLFLIVAAEIRRFRIVDVADFILIHGIACEKTCYQRHVIAECGCADPQIPMSGSAYSDFDGLACDIRNVTQGHCFSLSSVILVLLSFSLCALYCSLLMTLISILSLIIEYKVASLHILQ